MNAKKIKIPLEKPAVNISKLTGGINDLDGELYVENFSWIYILLIGTIELKSK